MPPSIRPAQVERDAAGAAFSPQYGDVYASRDGALGQARHVFLGGNDLPARWRGRASFVVVETGFGLGVNFLATWQAWRDDPASCARLHCVAVEKHPVAAADLLAFAPAPLAPLARALAAAWPLPLPGLHRLDFDDGALRLTLAFGDARALVPQLVAGADAFFLDGFAPDRNPELWEPPLIKALARLARPGATLATWCTARAVRDALAASGFAVELRPGYGHRRQMLAARFAPRWRLRRHEPPAAYAGERKALAIGAGLAGSWAAAALAQRGWQVRVLDSGAGPAAAASALPWGLVHPQFAADDNLLARLTRAGFLLGRQRLASAPYWQPGGVFQQARDEAEAARWRTALGACDDWPRDYLRWVGADEAAALIGMAPCRGGLWFAQGGVVSAARWCAALLAGSHTQFGTAVAALERRDGQWHALASDGRSLAAAPVVVVANALDAPRLLRLRHAPVQPVRGRISVLAGDLPLRAGVGGDGYLVRGADGWLGVGASYEFSPTDRAAPIAECDIHAGNLQRVRRLLRAAPPLAPTGVFDGVRCVARDRLPLAGAVADEAAALDAAAELRGAHLADLPRRAGLYCSFALGSRGLTLAPLAAELIAAQVEGEPWPVERALADALDPARFLLQKLRRG
jgi:tRNA 5-methylaminomethyl-2-thiouridine biosynthesis bifunctional protein